VRAGVAADSFSLNGAMSVDAKVSQWLALLRVEFAIEPIAIETNNNFPTSAGLASSASGFAALITAIDVECGLELSDHARSQYARLGSASAARSIYGGFVALTAPDWSAQPVLAAESWPLEVVIAITSFDEKTISSTQGMRYSAATSAFFDPWVAAAPNMFGRGRDAVERKDFAALAEVSEASCLAMHAVMTTTQPSLLYWNAATVACMHRVRSLRNGGLAAFYTIDAGPQVKVVCEPSATAEVRSALADIAGVQETVVTGLGPGASVIDP
jgi:diphosphomevalonate decarboxylase